MRGSGLVIVVVSHRLGQAEHTTVDESQSRTHGVVWELDRPAVLRLRLLPPAYLPQQVAVRGGGPQLEWLLTGWNT